ncbi:hypothetical protein AABB24_025902 [Solanum stoloniferum]|uniref:DNA helicase n=1 Tax=Solanum stoloniferum TaxID=62892 RepID=A0ABD2SCA9_9SOLN
MEKGKSSSKNKNKPTSSSAITLEQFVSTMAPLIDLEKDAEISVSMNSAETRSLDSAQKKGSTILNLKCVDIQTGLMGKMLLEFQSNKGDILPPHKFGTHDVVVLKPNKADLGCPALGQGVVYRLKVLRGDNSSLANDIRKEMKALNGKLLKAKDRNAKKDIRRELKSLSREERKRQQLAVTDVIKNADVVLTTLTGVLTKKLDGLSFDVVVIDEAAQALEIACWIALLKGSRCILAGDHLQLPPTIQSVEAEKKGLGKTLFERLADLYGYEIMSMLTVQYRMHELIMNWSSGELYENKIEAHSSVASHLLYHLEDVKISPSTEKALLLIDTAGCDMEEKKDEEDSTLNEGEAEVAIAHAKRLVDSGVGASDIGLITPYAAQVVFLKRLKSNVDKLKEMEISTVDGFQGREKEAIIISMVRSNSKKEVGFLSDRRRMNVAVTRARRQCCLVCDTETVSGDEFLKGLIEYFEEHGEYLSASEYVNE